MQRCGPDSGWPSRHAAPAFTAQASGDYNARVMNPLIKTGETLHGIGPDGVADWRTEVEKRDGLETRHVMLPREDAVPPQRRTLHLMMKTQRPSPGARLEARPLARASADVKVLRRWVVRTLGQAMVPVGEVRGSFGGDVDRIVVFKPARPFTFKGDEPQGEVALLVASGTPRGLLPFDRAGRVRSRR